MTVVLKHDNFKLMSVIILDKETITFSLKKQELNLDKKVEINLKCKNLE